MKRFFIIPVCVLLAAAGEGYPTKEEEAKIAAPYDTCIRAAAERIDDGSTDFRIETKSVADACKTEFTKMITELGKNLSPEDRKTLEASQSGQDLGFAAVAVGRVRSAKRGNPQP
jgi:hypothetical protein